MHKIHILEAVKSDPLLYYNPGLSLALEYGHLIERDAFPETPQFDFQILFPKYCCFRAKKPGRRRAEYSNALKEPYLRRPICPSA